MFFTLSYNSSEIFPTINATVENGTISNRLYLANQSSEYFGIDGSSADTFFQTYYSVERFVVECLLAAIAAGCNITGLFANKGHTYQHPAYHKLFKNLSVANTLAVSASWLTNNSIFFFTKQLNDIPNLCHMLLLLLALNLFSMAFGLISGMTLVGFGLIHYLAICWPLRYDAIVTTRRVTNAITAMWIIGPLIAFWPMPAYFAYTFSLGFCSTDYVGHLNIIGSDVAMGTLAICYISLTCMCLRLYHEVRKLQKRLSENLWVDDLKYEKKALVTIAMLLSTLTLFFLPYYIVYMVSMNSLSSSLNQNQAVLYYMMLLPYIKYASDPVIYGKRMLGLQEELRRKLVKACCVRLAERLRSSSNTKEDCTKKGQMYQMVTIV